MGKHADWYLIEVERLLKGRVPGPALAETLCEVAAHLEDSRDELAEACRHGEDPEELAIERFGTPWMFAKASVGQANLQPYWRAARWPMAICFASAMLPAYAICNKTWVWPEFWIGIVAFFAASFFARRRMPLATVASVAAAALLTILLGTLLCAPTFQRDFGTLRADLPRMIKENESALQRNADDSATLSRGIAYFSAATPAEGKPFGGPLHYLVPICGYRSGGFSYGANSPSGRITLVEGGNWKVARDLWQSSGPDLVRMLASDAENTRAEGERFHSALSSSPREALTTVAPPVGFAALLFCGFMFVLNSLAAGAANLATIAKLSGRRFA